MTASSIKPINPRFKNDVGKPLFSVPEERASQVSQVGTEKIKKKHKSKKHEARKIKVTQALAAQVKAVAAQVKPRTDSIVADQLFKNGGGMYSDYGNTRKSDASVIKEFEQPIKDSRRTKIVLLVLGILFLAAAGIGLGYLTNFKFDHLNLQSGQAELLTIATTLGVVLLVVGLLEKSKKGFTVPAANAEKETIETAPVKEKRERRVQGKVKVPELNPLTYVRKHANTGKST